MPIGNWFFPKEAEFVEESFFLVFFLHVSFTLNIRFCVKYLLPIDISRPNSCFNSDE